MTKKCKYQICHLDLDRKVQTKPIMYLVSDMGPLQLTFTWYKILHAGEQATHWDIQNKENSNLNG